MPELPGLIGGIATFYAAALVGLALARLVRRWLPEGRTQPRADWPVYLPILAVLVVPVAAAFHPSGPGLLSAWHALWHSVQQALLRVHEIHVALHAANLALLGLFSVLVVRLVFRLSRQHAFGAALAQAVVRLPGEERPVYRLPSSWPGCFTLGVARPRIVITSALWEQLDPEELAVVLAHEEAHLRRRDRLVETSLACFYALVPLPGTGRLLRDWRRSAERACDAHAAAVVSSREDVAATLLRVAQLSQPMPGPLVGASAFAEAEDDLEGRVAALLQRPEHRAALPLAPLGVSLVVMLAAGFWVRHLVELLVHH
ncbi:MAG: M56 family metallopeptidase [Armatimonadota bacterium]